MSDRLSAYIERKRRLKLHRRRWLELQHARNPRCYYCRNVTVLPDFGYRKERQLLEATLDHAIPQSHGGTDDPRNYRLACYTCNILKGSMPERDFIEELTKEGIR